MLKQMDSNSSTTVAKSDYMTKATKFGSTFKNLINLTDLSISDKIKKYVKELPPAQTGVYENDEDYIVENPDEMKIEWNFVSDEVCDLPFFRSIQMKLKKLYE